MIKSSYPGSDTAQTDLGNPEVRGYDTQWNPLGDVGIFVDKLPVSLQGGLELPCYEQLFRFDAGILHISVSPVGDMDVALIQPLQPLQVRGISLPFL